MEVRIDRAPVEMARPKLLIDVEAVNRLAERIQIPECRPN
jgi:hypothetical protein